MPNRTQAIPFLTIGALALAGACIDHAPVEPTASIPEVPQLFATPANPASHFFEGGDADLARIAEAVAGFGGYFYDDARVLNIYMHPSMQAVSTASALEALRGELAPLGVRAADLQGARVLEAQYDFAQLAAMHRQVTPVLGIEGVVYTDADEAANRIAIGVENAQARASVERALGMLGMPAGAVVLREAEPIQFMQTLQQRVRPVAGGLQINFPGFLCTLGFNVRSPGAPQVQGFVTNSHCTSQQWVTGNTPYWQPTGSVAGPSDPNWIGIEAHDAPGTTGGACPAGRICRNSDAAGVRYGAGIQNAFARIYRTTGFNSLTIDAANPFFNIVAEAPTNLAVGDSVHKVGRTTGWTRGVVTASCSNTNVGGTNFTIFCQDIVTGPTNSVAGGDSGSGAWSFFPLGQLANVRLNGILWGGSGSTVFVYSPMQRVRMDNPPPNPANPWRTFPPPPAP
jgi:hypothetical protein